MNMAFVHPPELPEPKASSLPLTILSQPPEVDFIDNRLQQYHPAFAPTGVIYSPEEKQYVANLPTTAVQDDVLVDNSLRASPRPAPSPVDKMQFWALIFPLAMESFQAQYPAEPKGRAVSDYSIRNAKSWEQVEALLKRAREAYENTAGVGGNLKKGMRKIVDNAPKLAGAVALVPDMETTTPVVSVLKVLLTAAKRTTEIRKAVTEGFEDLEQRFEDIEAYITCFPDDQNIVKTSTKMIASILKAVEDVVGYYISNRAKKALSIVFNGDEYRETLTSSLASITLASNALLHQAQNSSMWQNRESSERVSRLIRLETRQSAAYILNETKSLLEQYSLNILNLQMERDYYRAKFFHHEQNLLPQTPAWSTSGNSTHVQTILEHLFYEPDIALADMAYLQNSQELIPLAQRERTESLVRNQKFRDWILAPRSTELLIHGDFLVEGSGALAISALSLFSSMFLHGVRESGRFTALAFFCSRHLDRDDEDGDAGGRAMIKSLITQLLQQHAHEHHFDARIVDKDVDAHQIIEEGDIGQLVVLFRSLLSQLPRATTIICVIDGIKYYERDEYVDDMALVLRGLLDLTLDQNLGVVFKILVTSHSPTHIVRQAFSPTNIFTLDPLAGVGQGCSTTRFARDLDRDLQGQDA